MITELHDTIMEKIYYYFWEFNCDTISYIIRIIIGLFLIFSFSKMNNKTICTIKKYIISNYYIIISSIIIGGYLFESMKMIAFFSIFIFLSYQVIYIFTKYSIEKFVLLYLIIYEILETIIYGFNIEFSAIFGIEYVDVDYLNIYIKLILSLILGIAITIFFKYKNISIFKNSIFLVIGNYYIIGTIFGGVDFPHEVWSGWEDVFIPMLNVNFSPYFYWIIIIENIIMYYYIVKREDENEKEKNYYID